MIELPFKVALAFALALVVSTPGCEADRRPVRVGDAAHGVDAGHDTDLGVDQGSDDDASACPVEQPEADTPCQLPEGTSCRYMHDCNNPPGMGLMTRDYQDSRCTDGRWVTSWPPEYCGPNV